MGHGATFYNIASISKMVFANLWAKGLHLHEALRTWCCCSRSKVFTKKKNMMKDRTYLSKNSAKLQTINRKNLARDEFLWIVAKLRHWQPYSHDEFAKVSHPAQTHLAGPAQVKIYNTVVQKGPHNPWIYNFFTMVLQRKFEHLSWWCQPWEKNHCVQIQL
jgi:hypothetical protein